MYYLVGLGIIVVGYVLAFASGYYMGRVEGSRRARNVFQQRSEEVIPDRVPLAVDSKGTAVLVAVDDEPKPRHIEVASRFSMFRLGALRLSAYRRMLASIASIQGSWHRGTVSAQEAMVQISEVFEHDLRNSEAAGGKSR